MYASKYTLALFYVLFAFNAPCQFTPLPNLRSHFWFNALWQVYMHLSLFFFVLPTNVTITHPNEGGKTTTTNNHSNNFNGSNMYDVCVKK
jgi:hypothetical protein